MAGGIGQDEGGVVQRRQALWEQHHERLKRENTNVRPYGQPGSVFIQWKGTVACLDVLCLCGDYFHIDGMFAHAVRCPHCRRVLVLGDAVALFEDPDYPGEPLDGEALED